MSLLSCELTTKMTIFILVLILLSLSATTAEMTSDMFESVTATTPMHQIITTQIAWSLDMYDKGVAPRSNKYERRETSQDKQTKPDFVVERCSLFRNMTKDAFTAPPLPPELVYADVLQLLDLGTNRTNW